MKDCFIGLCGVLFLAFCCIGLELLAGAGGIGILTSLTDDWIALIIGISAIILVVGIFVFKKKGGDRCAIYKK